MRLITLTKVNLLLLLIFCALNSCTKEEYYTNPVDWDIAFKTITKADWKWNNSEGYYSAVVPMSQFTQKLVDDGGIVVAQDFGSSVYRPLPYTGYDIYNNENKTFSFTVDYEYKPGYIYFYYTYSDLSQGNPPTMTFKITSFY